MTYYANYKANDGTTFLKPIAGPNKKKLISEVREIANGQRFAGSTCSWTVWKRDGNNCIVIAAGGTRNSGKRYLDKERIGNFL